LFQSKITEFDESRAAADQNMQLEIAEKMKENEEIGKIVSSMKVVSRLIEPN
jgi:hypothetical protein